MDRRQLLKAGTAGLAALGTGALAPGRASAQTPGSGQGPQPPKPPTPDSLTDFGALRDEDWSEPWVWRPSEWPDQSLALNVVNNPHPPRSTTAGNRFAPNFSFNGANPGPTIRLRGDEVLRVRLLNQMGPNTSRVPKGPAPDPFEIAPGALDATICSMLTAEGRPCSEAPSGPLFFNNFDTFFSHIPTATVATECLTTPANTPHGTHTTNLHTHGLHVEPGVNANGTMGDNTHLRVLPRADGAARQASQDPACRALGPDDRVGEALYEHQLGDVQRAARASGAPAQPHPPGTHWYHPHAHGATHAQVASGMAGFLIVEGDVDDAINLAMTGEARPDPSMKTGDFDYRERLVMIQRVEVSSLDMDHGPRRNQGRLAPPTAVNGVFSPTTMSMRPGAVERWRVLNASVDGRGFKHFMVLDGHFVFHDRQLWRVLAPETAGGPPQIVPVSRQEVEDAKMPIHQLAMDGITLVTVENGVARHTIKDLSQQNAGSKNPLARPPAEGETPARALLRNIEDCFRDGASIRNAWVRPNQVFLANANRADVFFKAPVDAAGRVFTVFAQEVVLQTDNAQQRLQQTIATGRDGFNPLNPAPVDVVVGYVKVAGTAVPGGDFDVMSLVPRLPAVPPFLQPVANDELQVPAPEAARRGVPAGSLRTRVISYSGIGPVDFPLVRVPDDYARQHPELRRLTWDEINGAPVLLAPFAHTMGVNPSFDLAVNPDPPAPRKFEHHATHHPKALVDTAEEWVLYNLSMMLWSHTDTKRFPQPGQYALHYTAYPIGRAAGQARFARDPEFQITTKGADHPFHIHVNPCWVTRIEIPDEQGRLHNVLDQPRWMDTVPIPRHGGRVVFRSRFADYVGRWVNHCHILMHEDFGMMQNVESVARAEDANYNPRASAASHALSPEAVTAIYPRPSLELMYRQNLSFVDASPMFGQVYPGFPLVPPKLAD